MSQVRSVRESGQVGAMSQVRSGPCVRSGRA